MYILIDEDMQVRKSSTFTADDEEDCKNGHLVAVDISQRVPKVFYGDFWEYI